MNTDKYKISTIPNLGMLAYVVRERIGRFKWRPVFYSLSLEKCLDFVDDCVANDLIENDKKGGE